MLTDFVIAFRTNHQARKWENHVQLVQAFYQLTDRHTAEEITRRLMAAHQDHTPASRRGRQPQDAAGLTSLL